MEDNLNMESPILDGFEISQEEIKAEIGSIGADTTQIKNSNLPFTKFDIFANSEGSIEEYTDHPLNFDKSNEMARVIRASTSMFGEFRLALIDMFIGLYGLSKKYNLSLFGNKKVVDLFGK